MHTTIPFSALTQLFHGLTSEKPAIVVLEHRERAREEENRRLKRELERTRQERDILKNPLSEQMA
jgi:hypothetical protein